MTFLPGYPCEVCRRESTGATINLANGRSGHFCSNECGIIFMKRDGAIKHNESAAIRKGGENGGAYLDQIGKFDLRTLSEVEWLTFCEKVFTGTCDELARVADDEIPF